MDNPMISVVMPAFNCEKYITEAIDSILNQTYTDFELIVINDGSTDETGQCIQAYDDVRIRYFKNEINLQIEKTLNIGIELANGKYIARMDADDVSFPERFEKQIRFMEYNPSIDVCGTWLNTFGDKDEKIWEYPLYHEEIKTAMLFNSSIAHATVMIKKNFFNTFQYKEEYNKAEDYALWVESIKYKKFANIPFVLYSYRFHGSQTDKRKQTETSNKIRKIMLKEINCALNNKEMEDFLKVISFHSVPFCNVETIYNKILRANKVSGFLNQLYLEKFLGVQFWTFMNNHRNKGLEAFYTYNRSTLKQYVSLPLLSYIKFYFRCLVKSFTLVNKF